MIDIGRIAIPFNENFCTGDGAEGWGYVDLKECQLRGAKVQGGSIEYNQDGSIASVSDLSCPYGSLPSSNSTLAFKVFKGGENYWPFIELKASPAKLLQGHNVFGSCDPEKCLLALIHAFNTSMPSLAQMLDFHLAEIKQLDVTFSAHVESRIQGRQVIAGLKSISSGQTRNSKSAHATTCYFGTKSDGTKSSRHKQLKIYLKGYELESQIADYLKKSKNLKLPVYQRQISAMSSTEVIAFADKAVRFEASILPRMFKRLGIPTHLGNFLEYCENYNGCVVQNLWKEAFKDVFEALGDKSMCLFDDEEIFDNLKSKFGKNLDDGKVSYAKAERLFRFYREFKNEGWEEIKRTTPKANFYRNLKDLMQVVSKAHLQNLHGIGQNVVPMLRVINVDFSKQHPVGWQEPKHLCEQVQLRAVG